MSLAAIFAGTKPSVPKIEVAKTPCIIVVGGPPGCGKSSVAKKMVERFAGAWVRFCKDEHGKDYIDNTREHIKSLEANVVTGKKSKKGGVIIDMCMMTEAQIAKVKVLSVELDVPLFRIYPAELVGDLETRVDFFLRCVAGLEKRGAQHHSLGTKAPEFRARISAIFKCQGWDTVPLWCQEDPSVITVAYMNDTTTPHDTKDYQDSIHSLVTATNGNFDCKLDSKHEKTLNDTVTYIGKNDMFKGSRTITQIANAIGDRMK